MGSSGAQVAVPQLSMIQTSQAEALRSAVSASVGLAAPTTLASKSANNQSGEDVHQDSRLRWLRGFDGAADPAHPQVTSVAILEQVQPEVWTKARYHTISHQDYRKAVAEENKAKLLETKIDVEARPCIFVLPLIGMTYIAFSHHAVLVWHTKLTMHAISQHKSLHQAGRFVLLP